jgi:hypothetical protein
LCRLFFWLFPAAYCLLPVRAVPYSLLTTYYQLMKKIQFTYTQFITHEYNTVFEKNIFDDSHEEWLMQSQAYNDGGKLQTFEELIHFNPKAHSLHYKVGFSVGLYIQALKNIIPSLKDNAGNPSLTFMTCEFKIIQSSIKDKKQHVVALLYTSPAYQLLESFGEYLLLQLLTSEETITDNSTILLKIQPGFNIISYA